MQNWLDKLWYGKSAWRFLLLPLSAFFYLLSSIRKTYFIGQKRPQLSVPVIVVGNITVGGTGKTPLLIALIEHLKQQGLKPAVISRGYGGHATYPYALHEGSTAAAGDEPYLIYKRCGCPVVVAPKRLDAARYAINHYDIDVILSDDGLQHYALPRDLEILVLDGKRGLGNGWCLPAGPLRETAKRIKTVDLVVVNGENAQAFSKIQHTMKVVAENLVPLNDNVSAQISSKAVHAVAGIGNPERFFTSLLQLDFSIEKHIFNDHHAYQEQELLFHDQKPVVMTEKDAVKCLNFTALNKHWYLPVSAELSENFWQDFDQQLQPLLKKA